MRCKCLQCGCNEDYYCCLPEGKVGIDENGVCSELWTPSAFDGETEEVTNDDGR